MICIRSLVRTRSWNSREENGCVVAQITFTFGFETMKFPKSLLRNSAHGTVNSSMLVGQTPKSTLWAILCLLAGLYGPMLSGGVSTSYLIHCQGLDILLPIFQACPTTLNTVQRRNGRSGTRQTFHHIRLSSSLYIRLMVLIISTVRSIRNYWRIHIFRRGSKASHLQLHFESLQTSSPPILDSIGLLWPS